VLYKNFLLLLLLLQTCVASAQEFKALGVLLAIKGNGLVNIQRGDTLIQGLINQKLIANDVIKTTQDTSARILMFDDSVLNIAPNSELKVTEQESTLELLSGKIRCIVAKAIRPNQYKIKISGVTAGVRGTDFIMDYSKESDSLKVTGIRGTVSLNSKNGQEHNVTREKSVDLAIATTSNNFEVKSEKNISSENVEKIIKDNKLDVKEENNQARKQNFKGPNGELLPPPKEQKPNNAFKPFNGGPGSNFDNKVFDPSFNDHIERVRDNRLGRLRVKIIYGGRI